jgi:acyl-CoA synthetase (NDP forming)
VSLESERKSARLVAEVATDDPDAESAIMTAAALVAVEVLDQTEGRVPEI